MKSYQFVVLSMVVTAVAAFTTIDDRVSLIAQILIIIIFSLRLNTEESIRIIIFLFVLNGLQRRVMNGHETYFKSNDVLILMPYLAILFLVIRHRISVPFKSRIILFILMMQSAVLLASNFASIAWGILNFTLVLILSLHFSHAINEKLLRFFINIGVLTSIYIFWQKISMPEHDRGWCNQRRIILYILESCDSSSTRLWGTMESAINMAFFLSICIVILLSQRPLGRQRIPSIIKFFVLAVALFLTGTRTFLFLIPISLFLGLFLKGTFMGGKLLKGSIATALAFLALPSIAALFSYDERWTNRLNVSRLFQDESLQARTELVSTFLNSLDLSTFIFGDGIGTHSRGSSAIDNGYLALVLEVGFPMALLICLFISSLFIGRIKNIWENDLSVLSVATLSLLANSSFAVISGSSSVFLWIFCLAIMQRKKEIQV